MSILTIDQMIDLTEVLAILLGIAMTWAVFYGSRRAELPGEAQVPDPSYPDESGVDTRGRTLS